MIEYTSFQGFHVVSFCFILFHVSFPQHIPALCAAKAAHFPRVLSHPQRSNIQVLIHLWESNLRKPWQYKKKKKTMIRVIWCANII